MIRKTPGNEKGFIETIILLVIAFLILKYSFDFDIIATLKNEGIGGVLSKGFGVIKHIYTEYISRMVSYLFDLFRTSPNPPTT